MTESRIVTIPAGHIHHHDGQMYAGPCAVLLNAEDAEWLVSAIIGARVKRWEAATAIMATIGGDDGNTITSVSIVSAGSGHGQSAPANSTEGAN